MAIQHLFFGLLSFKIIQDWHHLEKKCKERLSMVMKGKQVKNKALEHILALLWLGKIDLAVTYLRGLNENHEEIKLLIGYFERNRSFTAVVGSLDPFYQGAIPFYFLSGGFNLSDHRCIGSLLARDFGLF